MKNNLRTIISLIIILILVAINIAIYLNYQTKNNEVKVSETNNLNSENENTLRNTVGNEISNSVQNRQTIVNSKISNMDEGDRIKSYFGRMIDAIETRNYELAYSYLNEDYKKNYFPTLEEFTTYIENNYPTNKIIVEYKSIERKGEIFVMYTVLHDAINDDFQALEQTVVVRENAINDFKISFSKKEVRQEERS